MERLEHVEGGEAIGLGEDDAHRLLAVERRRLAIDVLPEGGPWGLRALAEAIVVRERHGDVTEDAVNRTMVGLHHAHLPMMAELGAIEYDRSERRVVGCRISLAVESTDGSTGSPSRAGRTGGPADDHRRAGGRR